MLIRELGLGVVTEQLEYKIKLYTGRMPRVQAVSTCGLVARPTRPPLAVVSGPRQLPIVPKASARELLTETQVNMRASTQSFRDQTPTVLKRTL